MTALEPSLLLSFVSMEGRGYIPAIHSEPSYP